MKIKTFYAKTMAEALNEVKVHFGPDALLLSTKEVSAHSGTGASSGFEIVAAIDGPDGEPDTIAAGTYDLTSMRAAAQRGARKATQSRKVKSTSRSEVEAQSSLPFSGISEDLYRELIESGVHDWLARRVLNDALETLSARQKRSRTALNRSLAVVSGAFLNKGVAFEGTPGKRVVVFLGPTGVGKTTSIAKLAARLVLEMRKKVILMTLDGYRIGAAEQLRTYAGLMGVPFRFIDRVADLPKAIQENAHRDYILIDTAGRAPRDLDSVKELAAFLRDSGEIERHLVISATTKPVDMAEIVNRFEVCAPDYLIFTKLDETTTLGPLFNEVARVKKPISYYSDGQRVPEDLHVISHEAVIELVLRKN